MTIERLPCMKCNTLTDDRPIFPGLNLCHRCWYDMTPDMAVTMAKKASRIAYVWVHEKLKAEMIQRDIWVKKRMMLNRKSSIHKAGVKPDKRKGQVKPRKLA